MWLYSYTGGVQSYMEAGPPSIYKVSLSSYHVAGLTVIDGAEVGFIRIFENIGAYLGEQMPDLGCSAVHNDYVREDQHRAREIGDGHDERVEVTERVVREEQGAVHSVGHCQLADEHPKFGAVEATLLQRIQTDDGHRPDDYFDNGLGRAGVQVRFGSHNLDGNPTAKKLLPRKVAAI